MRENFPQFSNPAAHVPSIIFNHPVGKNLYLSGFQPLLRKDLLDTAETFLFFLSGLCYVG